MASSGHQRNFNSYQPRGRPRRSRQRRGRHGNRQDYVAPIPPPFYPLPLPLPLPFPYPPNMLWGWPDWRMMVAQAQARRTYVTTPSPSQWQWQSQPPSQSHPQSQPQPQPQPQPQTHQGSTEVLNPLVSPTPFIPLPHAHPEPYTPSPSPKPPQQQQQQQQQRTKSPSPPPVVTPPAPSQSYLDQATQSPRFSPTPRRLLIILDLNGTLIFRKNRSFPPRWTARSGLQEFMAEILAQHDVMIWTSSQPATVQSIMTSLFDKKTRNALLAVWDRTKLGLTKQQYINKVQVYKVLDLVWNDEILWDERKIAMLPKGKKKRMYAIKKKERKEKRQRKERIAQQQQQQRKQEELSEDSEESDNSDSVSSTTSTTTSTTETAPVDPPKRPIDQTNTVLIDDSKLKAFSNPHNVIEVPEFTKDSASADDSATLLLVLRKLRILSRYEDVSAKLHQWSEKEDEWVRKYEKAPGEGVSPLSWTVYWKNELDDEEKLLRKQGKKNGPRS